VVPAFDTFEMNTRCPCHHSLYWIEFLERTRRTGAVQCTGQCVKLLFGAFRLYLVDFTGVALIRVLEPEAEVFASLRYIAV